MSNFQKNHSFQELQLINNLFPKDIEIFVSEVNNEVKAGVVVFHVNSKTSLIFYNVIGMNMKDSQLSSFQLYNCLKICKINFFGRMSACNKNNIVYVIHIFYDIDKLKFDKYYHNISHLNLNKYKKAYTSFFKKSGIVQKFLSRISF